MKILLIAIAILAAVFIILFVIACIRAICIRRDYPEDKTFTLKDTAKFNAQLSHLSKIIAVPTVSVRGESNLSEIENLHLLLRRLYPAIADKCVIKDIDGALLIKWRGMGNGSVLLMSHQDVVGATGEWKYPPFSGAIAEGKLWGRGTVDTKTSFCAILEAVNDLIEEGFTPEADIYVASSSNEEITGDGAPKTVRYLQECGVRFDIVLDEGGLVLSEEREGKLHACRAMIGIMEKGRANIKFTARSVGGHASVPPRNTPIRRLSAFADGIYRNDPFKKRITKPARLQYKALSPYMKHFGHRLLYGNLWLFSPIAPYIMHRTGGAAAAAVKTTCEFTMAEGSKGANVIPTKASLTANCRFMPHENMADSINILKKRAARHGVETEVISGVEVAGMADIECEAYRQLSASIAETFGAIPQIPYIMLAGTDARHYVPICDCVIRFVPVMYTREQFQSAHSVNESVNTEALPRAVSFYRHFITSYRRNITKIPL